MDIARNANDIVARHLAGAVPRGAPEVLGIHDANVIPAFPADLPRVEVGQDLSISCWKMAGLPRSEAEEIQRNLTS